MKHKIECDKFYVLTKTGSSSSSKESKKPQSSESVASVKCKFCFKKFTLQKNCNRHELGCSAGPSSASPAILCDLCGSSFKRKDHLKTHQAKCRERHTGSPKSSVTSPLQCEVPKEKKNTTSTKLRTPCLCPDCEREFYHKTELILHLKDIHGCKVSDPVDFQFESEKKFNEWKEQEQERTFSYFSKKNGQSQSKRHTQYFYCQHDGTSHSQRKTSRLNLKGRVKVGHHCIAKMNMWTDSEGKVNVKYFPTHSHVCTSADFVHHPVSEETNKFINDRLSIGVSPTKVLKDVQRKEIPKTFSVNQIKDCKAAVLTKKRIRERARKLRERRRFHRDEAKALYLMVTQMAEEEDNILLYKPYRHGVKIGPREIDKLPDSKELFMLGIQTERQAQLMAEHGHKITIVDETHSTNHHKYQLLTVMVVDDNRRGWPVAHLISSKSDAETLQYFFKALKDKRRDGVPRTKIETVITDCALAFINAMEWGFVEKLRHLLCKWHILKAFKKNLRLHVPKDMVEPMMTELRVMVNAKEESLFLQLFDGFIKKYESSSLTAKFIKYFKAEYEKKHPPHKWAMCYRNFPHANVNTTGHVESFHHRLKKVYLRRKVNRRLDDLFNYLLELEWDDHLTRIQEATLGLSFQPQVILARHKRGVAIEDDFIAEVEDNTWDVKSSSGNDKYHIVRYRETCDFQHCYAKCVELACSGLCAHIYSCSCPDNHPLCKHIHKLHSMLTRGDARQMRDNETLFENAIDKNQDEITEGFCNIEVPCPGEEKKKNSSRDCKILEDNIMYLTNLLNSGTNSSVLSFAASSISDIVRQLKFMEEESEECIPSMTPAVTFNSNEKLKTQASQIKSFKKPPKKRKSDNKIAVTSTKKKAVIDDLLAHCGQQDDECYDDPDDLQQADITCGIPPSVQPNYFTPPLSFALKPEDVLLKIDSEMVTLLDLKRLELNLTLEDTKTCKKLDAAFNVGWLSDAIINSYLSLLVKEHSSCCCVMPTDLAWRASRGRSNVNYLTRKLEETNKKQAILFPGNLSGDHWVIAAVVFNETPAVWFYDSLQAPMDDTAKKLVEQINADMRALFPTLSNWNVEDTIYVIAEKQMDSKNCGVHICAFSEQIATRSLPYKLVKNTIGFRKKMYQVIVGGCLKHHHREEEDKCGICRKVYPSQEDDEDDPWIECVKCHQWFHELCVPGVIVGTGFTCPK